MKNICPTKLSNCSIFHFRPDSVKDVLDDFKVATERELKLVTDEISKELEIKAKKFQTDLQKLRDAHANEMKTFAEKATEQRKNAFDDFLTTYQKTVLEARQERDRLFRQMKKDLTQEGENATISLAKSLAETTKTLEKKMETRRQTELEKMKNSGLDSMRKATAELRQSLQRTNVEMKNELVLRMSHEVAKEDLKLFMERSLLELKKATALSNMEAEIRKFQEDVEAQFAPTFEEQAIQHQELLDIKEKYILTMQKMEHESIPKTKALSPRDRGIDHQSEVAISLATRSTGQMTKDEDKVDVEEFRDTKTREELAELAANIPIDIQRETEKRKKELMLTMEQRKTKNESDISTVKHEIDQLKKQLR